MEASRRSLRRRVHEHAYVVQRAVDARQDPHALVRDAQHEADLPIAQACSGGRVFAQGQGGWVGQDQGELRSGATAVQAGRGPRVRGCTG